MKRFSLHVLLFIITACGHSSNESKDQKTSENSEQITQPTHSSTKQTLTFQKVNGEAILVGKKLDVLDESLQRKTTIKEHTIVEIIGVSDSLFQKSKDYCDSFRYV